MSISQKEIWLQAVILKKLQIFDFFLSNDKLNVLRIGIHTFHAYFAGKCWLFKSPMFCHFFTGPLGVGKIEAELYDQYFPSFSYFANLFHELLEERNNSKIWETWKILAISIR